MPLYALELRRSDDSEPAVSMWDSGEARLHVHDVFERNGRRWEVVESEKLRLDTPDGIDVVQHVFCDECA